MKKYECYMIQCEIKHPWRGIWERKGEAFKTLKEVKGCLKVLKRRGDFVRNIKIFKMAPYEEIDV